MGQEQVEVPWGIKAAADSSGSDDRTAPPAPCSINQTGSTGGMPFQAVPLLDFNEPS
jgi:hypothetical protein